MGASAVGRSSDPRADAVSSTPARHEHPDQCGGEPSSDDLLTPPLLSTSESLCSADPRFVFAAHALPWLAHLLLSPLTLYYTVNRRLEKFGGPVVVEKSGAITMTDLRSELRRHRHHFQICDPFVPKRFADSSAAVVDSSEFGPARALASTPYFGEYLRNLGAQRQTTLFLRNAGKIVAGIDILHSSDPGSHKHALSIIRAAQPLLEHAYGCVLAGSAPVPAEARPGSESLTPRQREIAMLVAKGASNREVARALMISESTVKTHLMHIFETLKVRSRTQLSLALNGGS